MIVALFLAAATPTAIDAERAFAADAQKIGQWTAFRKYADPTAIMFNPQAVWAHELLKDSKDPPRAIRWWPARSFVSCDRDVAVNTGPSRNEARATDGYFTTVWVRQKDGGWKWSVDGGDTLKRPLARPASPAIRRASCIGLARLRAAYAAETPTTASIAGKAPADAGQGRSADGTLTWSWRVAKDGARRFETKLWNGRRYAPVLVQNIAAPPK